METISFGIKNDPNIIDLKEIPTSQIRPEASSFLVDDEQMVQCFQTVHDQVIFTTKRIFVIGAQGITGKKVSYFSYPYSKVQYFGVETAEDLDIASELYLAFNDGNNLRFVFKSQVDIKKICSLISSFIL